MNILEAGLAPPSDPSIFEELLARIPDTELTRSFVSLSDMAAMRDIAGFELPVVDNRKDAFSDYVAEISRAYDEGLPVVFPAWPAELRVYAGAIDTFPYLGFDFLNIDQIASAGVPPNMFDVALGQYDPEVTANALANCECDQPEIREHSGVQYYAWGEGLRGDLNDRFKPPFYDHLGRGPRLLIEDGAASYSIRDGNIPALIDASIGTTPSLADNEDYLEAVRWLTSFGTSVVILIKNSGFSVEIVRQIGVGNAQFGSRDGKSLAVDYTAASVAEAVNKGPLLLPFTSVASGEAFDGESRFTGLVLVHEDPESAEENVGRLISRIREGALDGRFVNLEYTDTPWTDLIRRIDVQAYGRFLVARLYPLDPVLSNFTQGAISNRILVVHE